MNRHFREAYLDLRGSLVHAGLISMLGWQDIRLRYRRSTLGPFWITISVGVMIAMLGFVFGSICRSPVNEFLPFLGIGMILWTFISQTAIESCQGFTAAEGMVKQLNLPMSLHILRIVWKNVVFLAHNIIILPLLYLVLQIPLHWCMLLSIPGFFLLLLNEIWLCILAGVVCTRYRDLYQIVINLFQIAFYVTPIIWTPAVLPARAKVMLLDANPFYHLLEIVRAPLLGQIPTLLNYGVAAGIAACGWLAALYILGRSRKRIAYWL